MNALDILKKKCPLTDLELCVYSEMQQGHIRLAESSAAELARLQAIEKAAEDLFQACANLPLPEMDRMEKEISALATALS